MDSFLFYTLQFSIYNIISLMLPYSRDQLQLSRGVQTLALGSDVALSKPMARPYHLAQGQAL